jgi:hypothetical protein
MAKPRWQRILELEEAARRGSVPSDAPPMPTDSLAHPEPALERMASDIQTMRRQNSINFYAPGVSLLILIGIAYFILVRP